MPEPFAIQYSDRAKTSRDELPAEVRSELFKIIDKLADNPDANPEQIHAISTTGNVRLYKNPSPPLEITFEVDADRRVLYLQHFVAPQVSVTKPVFISYSHKDAEWLDRLKTYLEPLENNNLIRVWDDTEIRPGAEWLPEIRKALGSARVAVLLITQNFLNSPFIKTMELPALLDAASKQGCVIFWIPIRRSNIADTPLARFQAAIPPDTPLAGMSMDQQDKVLLEIYYKMKDAVSQQ
jgi:mRNA-degrading endonuclease RelE of RelBE toxin-antitoxin system